MIQGNLHSSIRGIFSPNHVSSSPCVFVSSCPLNPENASSLASHACPVSSPHASFSCCHVHPLTHPTQISSLMPQELQPQPSPTELPSLWAQMNLILPKVEAVYRKPFISFHCLTGNRRTEKIRANKPEIQQFKCR